MNLPIFRAKKIDSDEYVIGYYYKDNKDHIIFNGDSTTIFGLKVIDISTLSIHFPDMLDSQGNRIFASLSEDGKGGDIVRYYTKDATYLKWDKLSKMINFYYLDGNYAHSDWFLSMKARGIKE